MIEPARLKELEPHAAGVKAIHVTDAGIIDFSQVCLKLGELITTAGHRIELNVKVTGMTCRHDETVVHSTKGDFCAGQVVNCAGLYSDHVARMSGIKPAVRIVPFRGEYFTVIESKRDLCRNLIYPVPDLNFPFLGVHFTRTIDGRLGCGPNAVLAFAREGYTWTDINLGELFESLSYPGFMKLAVKYWRTGSMEMWRSLSKRAFVRSLRKLVPAVELEDLVAADSGVRAQAVYPDGRLLDDFLIDQAGSVINVCNAPSPAATSAIPIGEYICDKVEDAQEGI